MTSEGARPAQAGCEVPFLPILDLRPFQLLLEKTLTLHQL